MLNIPKIVITNI